MSSIADFKVRIQTTARGTLFGNVLLSDSDPDNSPLISSLSNLLEKRDDLGKVMLPEALPMALRESVEGRTAIAEMRIYFGKKLSQKREAEAAERNLTSAIIDPANGFEYRNLWRSLSMAEQAKRLKSMSLAEASALTLYPDIANVAVQLRPQIGERARLLAHIERTAMAAMYPNRPSMEGDILATGVDEVAVQRAGEAALAKHNERLKQSKNDDSAIRAIIQHFAYMFDQPAEAVLEQVTAK